ncbi:zinc-binding dehydrogenase [Streptomyces sp. B-S-A8]|uniref:Zinc-binding dehydrogenase n=1 Tax=Streptomyces solicavernae TaxID=3043614 RepID=A0ABT6RKW7_9ACTN|nr:zinc-binding dehydrogenase [Streptomyces sp. B-S-A8]MDI3385077.1 zinc-binding dehydrogenase [Streptomyces sp. B-S-A8]
MTHEVRAVVVRETGAHPSVETVLVPDPGPGEVLVRVRSCGICPADLDWREGGPDGRFPVLLGHEAAGVVAAAGAGVAGVRPGDFVVLNPHAPCGSCRSCRHARARGCAAPRRAARPMTLTDGTELSPALGVGALAECTLVAAGQCVKADPAVSSAAAALLGCNVLAGYGAAVHAGAVGRGDSVAVIGCGSVGLAAVAGARAAGAGRVIAVDPDGRRLDLAERFGVTGTVNSARIDAVEGVRALTGGLGADVVVDAVGSPETYAQAFYARDLAGTVVLAGAPARAATVRLPLSDVFARGGVLSSPRHGGGLPARDIGALLDLHLKGRLDLGAFLGPRIGLGDVGAAFEALCHGDMPAPVVLL